MASRPPGKEGEDLPSANAGEIARPMPASIPRKRWEHLPGKKRENVPPASGVLFTRRDRAAIKALGRAAIELEAARRGSSISTLPRDGLMIPMSVLCDGVITTVRARNTSRSVREVFQPDSKSGER